LKTKERSRANLEGWRGIIRRGEPGNVALVEMSDAVSGAGQALDAARRRRL
jgi:hypothetical protein